jgi:hypothetical protein
MAFKVPGKVKNDPLNLPCKKAIYHSQEEAMDMISYINETRVTKAIRPYKCPVCGFWHLTST